MSDEGSNDWSTGAVVFLSLGVLLAGLILGWFAHGLMMHWMMGGGMMDGGMGMMGNRGMMRSMMDGKAGMNRSGMMGGNCPMMQAPADGDRQPQEVLDSPVLSQLNDETREWVQSIRGDAAPEDARGQQNVTVAVGAGDQGLAFGTPVLRVDPGTTVTFRWTGRGGVHNVNVLESERKSELSYEEGTTYEVTFDESGVYRYVCDPHRPLGMKGVIIVEQG